MTTVADPMPRNRRVPLWRLASMRQPVLLAVIVFAAAFTLYLPALGNEFAYDDVPIIQLDERVHEFDVRAILTEGYWDDTRSALYRPLTTLTYAVDWQVSGGSPAWFHFVNGLWHAAVSTLLFQLLIALAVAPLAAFGAAIVFAVHPVHVEAVANTVGRAELMAAAFTLVAALLWARPPRVARSIRGGVALVAVFTLALLSKESAVVLPGLLVVVDIALGRLRRQRLRAWLFSRRAPIMLLGACLFLFFVLRVGLIGALTPTNLDPSLEVLASPSARFYTALQAWPEYVRLLFYPRVLLADYGPRILMPAVSVHAGVFLGASVLALAISGAVLAWLRGQRMLLASLLWFLVAVMPVSNLIVRIGVLVAERTLYLPSVALSLAIAAAVGPLQRRLPRSLALAAPLAVCVLVALFAARTLVRIPEWRTTHTIFEALRRDRPDSFRGAWHFARVAVAQDRREEALRLHSEALELWPYRRKLVQEAALYAGGLGLAERARNLTTFALDRWPDDLPLRRLHAGLLLDGGDTLNARRHIMDGLRWHPDDELLLRMLDAAQPEPPPAPGS